MNKFIYNSVIFLLLIIILVCAFSRSKAPYIPFWFDLFNIEKKNYEESFIPKIVKETYRPIERNVRRKFEGFYDKSSTNISNLFRKFGIL